MIRRLKANLKVMKMGIESNSFILNIIGTLILIFLSGQLYWNDYIKAFQSFGTGENLDKVFNAQEYMVSIIFLVAFTIQITGFCLPKSEVEVERMLEVLPINKKKTTLGRILGVYISLIPGVAIIIMVYASSLENFYISGVRGIVLIFYILIGILITLFNIIRFDERFCNWKKRRLNLSNFIGAIIILIVAMGTLDTSNSIVKSFYSHLHSNTFIQVLGNRMNGIVVGTLITMAFLIFNYIYVKRINSSKFKGEKN